MNNNLKKTAAFVLSLSLLTGSLPTDVTSNVSNLVMTSVNAHAVATTATMKATEWQFETNAVAIYGKDNNKLTFASSEDAEASNEWNWKYTPADGDTPQTLTLKDGCNINPDAFIEGLPNSFSYDTSKVFLKFEKEINIEFDGNCNISFGLDVYSYHIAQFKDNVTFKGKDKNSILTFTSIQENTSVSPDFQSNVITLCNSDENNKQIITIDTGTVKLIRNNSTKSAPAMDGKRRVASTLNPINGGKLIGMAKNYQYPINNYIDDNGSERGNVGLSDDAERTNINNIEIDGVNYYTNTIQQKAPTLSITNNSLSGTVNQNFENNYSIVLKGAVLNNDVTEFNPAWVTGLPAGLTASVGTTANSFNISGTPTSTGTGTITVTIPKNSVTSTSVEVPDAGLTATIDYEIVEEVLNPTITSWDLTAIQTIIYGYNNNKVTFAEGVDPTSSENANLWNWKYDPTGTAPVLTLKDGCNIDTSVGIENPNDRDLILPANTTINYSGNTSISKGGNVLFRLYGDVTFNGETADSTLKCSYLGSYFFMSETTPNPNMYVTGAGTVEFFGSGSCNTVTYINNLSVEDSAVLIAISPSGFYKPINSGVNLSNGIYLKENAEVKIEGTTYKQTIISGVNHNYVNGICTGTDTNGNTPCSLCGAGYSAYEEPVFHTDSSVYEISSAGELFWFAEKVNSGETDIDGVLTDDIDFSNIPDGVNWSPIGTNTNKYSGIFDGAGHVLQNFTVEKTGKTDNFIGLFGCVNHGTIKNIGIDENSSITGYSSVGSIAGQIENGTTIENVYSLAKVIGKKTSNPLAGGLVGGGSSSSIKNSYFAGTTKDNFSLITASEDITVDNAYYELPEGADKSEYEYEQGTLMTAEQFKSGEVAYLLRSAGFGQNIDNDKVKEDYPDLDSESADVYKAERYEDCSSNKNIIISYTNTVVDEKAEPQPAEHKYDYSSKEKDATCGVNELWNVECSVCHHKTTQEKPDTALKHDYDSDGFCKIDRAYEPAVYKNYVYEIYNAGQLFWFAEQVNKGEDKTIMACLMNDIVIPNGHTWTPIDNYEGHFNGNCHTISNLNVVSDGQYVGMFATIKGKVANGRVKYAVSHLGIENSTFTSTATTDDVYMGAIAGYNSTNGYIYSCYSANVTFNADNAAPTVKAAGLVGLNARMLYCSHSYGIKKNANIDGLYGIYAGDVIGAAYSGVCYLENESITSPPVDDYKRTAKQFKSGEVWVDLSSTAFKQTLGTDLYPNFKGAKVYSGYKHGETDSSKVSYSNTDNLHERYDYEYAKHDDCLSDVPYSQGDEKGHIYRCTECGEDITKVHSYTWEIIGKEHVGTCTECGYESHHDADEHNEYFATSQYHYSANGCGHDGCNYDNQKMVADEHNFTDFTYLNSEYHIAACDVCDSTWRKPHDFDENGVCTDCGYEKALEDTISVSDVSYTVSSGKNRVVFSVLRNIPAKYTVVEAGVLYSNNGTVNTENAEILLNFDKVNGTDIKKGVSTLKLNYAIQTAKIADNGEGVYIRGYVKVLDPKTNQEIIIYATPEYAIVNA